MPPEGRLKELKELRAASEKVEEACLGLWWHLFREPSAGANLPGLKESFFLYKQEKIIEDIPDISVVYTFDLDELVITALHLDFGDCDC